jgi:putative mRNA 3-end processing factor
MALFVRRAEGLYCQAGDFFVDPWVPVERAVLTHAHGDHAVPGSATYLVSEPGLGVATRRLGDNASIRAMPYGLSTDLNGVRISFHPAGHILGSAQVRAEHRGEVWVISGDYKTEPDPTCAPFEPVPCHTFVTESTFALPIYRWRSQAAHFKEINGWWRDNQARGRASVLFAYPLGKAQRVMAGVDAGIGPIYTHGAVEQMAVVYRAGGVALPASQVVVQSGPKTNWSEGLIIAPPSANGTIWMRRFGDVSTAFVSGWMQLRGTRRRRTIDRGFPLSDHADWPGLLETVRATGAQHVWVTHGHAATFARYLRETGVDAQEIATPYEGEADDLAAPADEG